MNDPKELFKCDTENPQISKGVGRPSHIDILFVHAHSNDPEFRELLKMQVKSYNESTRVGELLSGHSFRVVYANYPDFADNLRGIRFGQIRLDPTIRLSDRQLSILQQLVVRG